MRAIAPMAIGAVPMSNCFAGICAMSWHNNVLDVLDMIILQKTGKEFKIRCNLSAPGLTVR